MRRYIREVESAEANGFQGSPELRQLVEQYSFCAAPALRSIFQKHKDPRSIGSMVARQRLVKGLQVLNSGQVKNLTPGNRDAVSFNLKLVRPVCRLKFDQLIMTFFYLQKRMKPNKAILEPRIIFHNDASGIIRTGIRYLRRRVNHLLQLIDMMTM